MDEINFFLALRDIEKTGTLSDSNDLKEFINVVTSMRRLLNTYYWESSEDDPFHDDEFEIVWNDFITQNTVQGELISTVVYAMIDDLNLGDYDDVFGPSGWSDMLFN